MIDIDKARESFKKFLDKYKEEEDTLGFNLKVKHTYHVTNNSRIIATKLKFSEEDIKLAELIGILHDIGRFEEVTMLKEFDSVNFNHAEYGTKILFEDNLIRNFITDNSYDEIIKVSINNHNRLAIEDNLNERCLLHSKIIRDADKLDNFRVKIEERIEEVFPGKAKNKSDIENSTISDKVYNTVLNRKCVDIHDRETLLDYFVCILAFAFDLNFKESYEIVKNNNYINRLIDRISFNDLETKNRIEEIRSVINSYIDEQIAID